MRYLLKVMDPATIFQIVGTVVSLGDVVIKCIARLSTLKAQVRTRSPNFHDHCMSYAVTDTTMA